MANLTNKQDYEAIKNFELDNKVPFHTIGGGYFKSTDLNSIIALATEIFDPQTGTFVSNYDIHSSDDSVTIHRITKDDIDNEESKYYGKNNLLGNWDITVGNSESTGDCYEVITSESELIEYITNYVSEDKPFGNEEKTSYEDLTDDEKKELEKIVKKETVVSVSYVESLIDNAISGLGNVLTYKGSKSLKEIIALTDVSNGEVYNVTGLLDGVTLPETITESDPNFEQNGENFTYTIYFDDAQTISAKVPVIKKENGTDESDNPIYSYEIDQNVSSLSINGAGFNSNEVLSIGDNIVSIVNITDEDGSQSKVITWDNLHGTMNGGNVSCSCTKEVWLTNESGTELNGFDFNPRQENN